MRLRSGRSAHLLVLTKKKIENNKPSLWAFLFVGYRLGRPLCGVQTWAEERGYTCVSYSEKNHLARSGGMIKGRVCQDLVLLPSP